VYVIDGSHIRAHCSYYHSGTSDIIWLSLVAAEDLWVSGSYNTVSVIDTEYNQVHSGSYPVRLFCRKGLAICPQRVVEDLLLLPPDQSNSRRAG
jgi:hypothetical protein